MPISLTVFNQKVLDEHSVTNAADLANLTPSLRVDSRFGSDQTSFAVRGFRSDCAPWQNYGLQLSWA